MQPQFRPPVQLVQPVFSEAWFEALFLATDHLHDAICMGNRAMPLDPEQMIGWLEDIIYTAEQTIQEIRTHNNESRKQAESVTDAELFGLR
ncbi:MAG: hypothetical protein GYB65_24175 [Chloroflexi bacterium]|nr:hypothetical protein [Chloroflexota bacterium]